MAKRPQHDWQYKVLADGKGFWVVCADCGKSDQVLATESEAKARINWLRSNPPSAVLNSHFPRNLRYKDIKKRLRA